MINDPDLFFALGLVVGAAAFPALLTSFSSSDGPRGAGTLIVMAAGLIGIAVLQNPTGYSVEQAPDIFFEVVNRYVN